MRVKLQYSVRHNGRTYPVGATVEVTEAQAAELRAAGVLDETPSARREAKATEAEVVSSKEPAEEKNQTVPQKEAPKSQPKK